MISLRETCLDDMLLIYNWANDPEVRAESFSTEPIPLEVHKKWFEKTLKTPDILFYIMADNEVNIGQIRLSVEEDTAIISYMIDPNFRGKGYGKKIIELAEKLILEEKTDVIYLKAEVKVSNEASCRVFSKCGYEKKDETNHVVFIKKIR